MPKLSGALIQSGAARVAVLGINDGLSTHISLILGIVGATRYPQRRATRQPRESGGRRVLYGSRGVRVHAGQVELFEKGLVEARAATRDLSGDPEQALTVYSRAVLGVNPEALGSPWTSVLSSFQPLRSEWSNCLARWCSDMA